MGANLLHGQTVGLLATVQSTFISDDERQPNISLPDYCDINLKKLDYYVNFGLRLLLGLS